MSDAEPIEVESQDSEARAEPEEEWAPKAPFQPEQVRIWEDAFRKLCISVDGKEHTNVRARRVFPLTSKADYVSFLDEDEKEVALLAHPHGLDKQSRQALEEALGRMYYVAKITRVDSITEKMGVSKWQVETDRGYATFEVADRSRIRRLARGGILIVDADGNRFEIEDVTQLDEASQALVFSET